MAKDKSRAKWLAKVRGDPSFAAQAFAADRALFESRGITFQGARSFLPEAFGRDYRLAMDALPGLIGDAYPGFPPSAILTDPNSAVPVMLATWISPDIYEIFFAKTEAANIIGEKRQGDWTQKTAMFPVAEHAGEVTSYGDRATAGRTTVNVNWPNYQSYLYQTILEWGELELEMAGLGRINWVSELNKAAATNMDIFMNLTYFFGVTNLQNYGLLNDPLLAALLTPATKAAGGVTWFTGGGSPNASANEVYNDIVAIFQSLVTQTAGRVNRMSKLTLALSPGISVALTFTNSFNVNVADLLTKNFPNLEIKEAVQYGVQTTQNPQGNAAGNLVQLIAKEVSGQETGFAAYNEKMRAHKIIFLLSSFQQKVTGGSWGSIIRFPAGIAGMVGV